MLLTEFDEYIKWKKKAQEYYASHLCSKDEKDVRRHIKQMLLSYIFDMENLRSHLPADIKSNHFQEIFAAEQEALEHWNKLLLLAVDSKDVALLNALRIFHSRFEKKRASC